MNGRDIYEGDILTGDRAMHVVEYRDEESGFVGVVNPVVKDKFGHELTSGLPQWWITKYNKEVVGNIHDNPKMIKR